MSAVVEEKPVRDEKRDAVINLVVQLVFALPALALFGFTAINIAAVVIFLVIATVRFFHPTERMRKIEFWLCLALLPIWLATVIF